MNRNTTSFAQVITMLVLISAVLARAALACADLVPVTSVSDGVWSYLVDDSNNIDTAAVSWANDDNQMMIVCSGEHEIRIGVDVFELNSIDDANVGFLFISDDGRSVSSTEIHTSWSVRGNILFITDGVVEFVNAVITYDYLYMSTTNRRDEIEIVRIPLENATDSVMRLMCMWQTTQTVQETDK